MTWQDRARGAYVRSPAFFRQTVRPLMGLVPARLKFGRTYQRWRHDIAHARRDRVFASERHLASLRALLAKAHAGSPFYRELIETSFGTGFEANAITLDDLGHLPILDKATLRAVGLEALAVPRHEVDRVGTSGSNAEAPFDFYADKDRSAREIAFVYDVWSRVGFSETEARAGLRGFGLDPKGRRIHDWDPALRELRLAVFPMTLQDAAAHLDAIDARGVQFIYGYPSAVELFCRHLLVLGRAPKLPIKGILPISEPVLEHQRQVIISALGNPPFACFYGLSEKVLFAAEVPGETGTYEFNPLYGLAELVDEDGKQVTEVGREGRLIGTGFLSTGMPFIRYETGDFARLVELPTSHNGQRLRVSDLTPRRKPNFLIAQDGTRVVTTYLTPYNWPALRGIAEFQFYQDQPGEVLIRYILGEGGTPDDAEHLADELERRCHHRLHFTPQPVTQIATGRSGKRAFIDQRLDFVRY